MRYLLLAFILSCSSKHNITGPSDNLPTKCKHHHEHHHDHDNDKNKMEKQR